MAFIPLFIIQKNLNTLIESDIISRSVGTIETAWTNFAFMIIIVSGLTIMFHKKYLKEKLTYFSSFGRMSLSNYIIQSIIISSIYYGFGLGLYKYTSPTYGIIIGILLSFMMGYFCQWWFKTHKHGPLEGIWHKLTWLGSK